MPNVYTSKEIISVLSRSIIKKIKLILMNSPQVFKKLIYDLL
jgi:hypothetical protein